MSFSSLSLPSMNQFTLVYPIRGNQVLLGQKIKATGFGVNKILGYGGILDEGESIERTAQRELEEESGLEVTFDQLMPSGFLYARYPFEEKSRNQMMQIWLYRCWEWRGNPINTKEMSYGWYNLDNLPFAQMMPDNHYWMRQMLTAAIGTSFNVEVEYASRGVVASCLVNGEEMVDQRRVLY